jgi:hypothetical protein
VDQRGLQVAERHSSQNGQHGGPKMPLFYGVICSMGLMGAALSILMTGQIFGAHPKMNNPISLSGESAEIDRIGVLNYSPGNKRPTDRASKLDGQRLSRTPI